MLNRVPTFAATALLAAAFAAPAFAQSTASTMSHDGMANSTISSGSGMKHDSMGHGSAMQHGTMGSNNMTHSNGSGSMSHDTMSNSQ